ncbi:hypothetical protein [Natronospora cellulosivora (SeqCode)]
MSKTKITIDLTKVNRPAFWLASKGYTNLLLREFEKGEERGRILLS